MFRRLHSSVFDAALVCISLQDLRCLQINTPKTTISLSAYLNTKAKNSRFAQNRCTQISFFNLTQSHRAHRVFSSPFSERPQAWEPPSPPRGCTLQRHRGWRMAIQSGGSVLSIAKLGTSQSLCPLYYPTGGLSVLCGSV